SFGDQDSKLTRGVDVLITTPGRLLDHTERGGLLLTGVELLVIDEADRMLDMGFIPDIERVCKLVPFTRQTLFFTATMPPEISRISEAFLHNPERIEVSKPATTAVRVSQFQVPDGHEAPVPRSRSSTRWKHYRPRRANDCSDNRSRAPKAIMPWHRKGQARATSRASPAPGKVHAEVPVAAPGKVPEMVPRKLRGKV